MKKMAGMTLVELLIVMVILALLMAVAVPNFRSLMVRRAATAAASALSSDYRLARSEAIRRTTFVTICRSSDGASCGTADSWHTGWIVFLDSDQDRVVDAGEEVLRVQGAVDGIASMQAISGVATDTRPANTFRTNGLSTASAESLVITASSSVLHGTRLVCISNQGRPSVREAGTASC